MKAEINIDVLQNLIKKQTSGKLILEALKVFKISKKNWKQQSCLYISSFLVALVVGMSKSTVSVVADSAQLILDIILALFGIVFTGYALFQALINNELLIRLLCDTSKDAKEEEKSKLQETNETFVKCMLLNIVAIIVSLLLRITISCVPENYILFKALVFNNVIATFLISIYYYFVITIIWEVKSFVFNIFQLFNAYAGTRVLGMFENGFRNIDE